MRIYAKQPPSPRGLIATTLHQLTNSAAAADQKRKNPGTVGPIGLLMATTSRAKLGLVLRNRSPPGRPIPYTRKNG